MLRVEVAGDHVEVSMLRVEVAGDRGLEKLMALLRIEVACDSGAFVATGDLGAFAAAGRVTTLFTGDFFRGGDGSVRIADVHFCALERRLLLHALPGNSLLVCERGEGVRTDAEPDGVDGGGGIGTGAAPERPKAASWRISCG